MARKREFDEEKVLDALQDVFWEHGYDGTSYAQIMAATGLQKGSLYAAFGDKRALYQKAIARYDKGQVSDGVAMLRDISMSGKDRIAMLFQSLIDAAQTRRGRWGCMLCNAATDQAPFDPDTETNVKQSMARLKAGIALALEDTDKPDLSEWIWAAYFGGQVLVKAGTDKATLKGLQTQILAQL